MSVVAVGRAPFRRVLGYEKMLDEHGREMHGSWGNMISAEDAFARMGADVMRWQYCAQPPDRDLLFGFGPAHEIRRRLLTFWNSVWFLVTYVVIWFAVPLNQFTFLGFPFAFYMGAQGSLIVYVALIVFYAWYMNRLDREFGVSEEGLRLPLTGRPLFRSTWTRSSVVIAS